MMFSLTSCCVLTLWLWGSWCYPVVVVFVDYDKMHVLCPYLHVTCCVVLCGYPIVI